MEWNQNSNGAVAPPQSQQYLLPTTSSNVANGQSQFSSVNQHSVVQNRSFNSNNRPLLQNLLKANTNEEISQIQQAALGKYRSSKPNRSINEMTSSIHISSYKTARQPVSIVDNINAIPNTVGSNYRKSTYVNTVHQTPQQPLPSVAIAQQFGGNGYNTSVQQQNSQALQNYQPTVTYTYPQQNMVYNSVRPPTNAVQFSYQQMSPNVPLSNMYSLQSGVPGLYISSQNLPAEVNISTPMQNCTSSQTFTSPSLTNCRGLAPNMLPHVPQQQISVPQLQTLQQLDGNSNCSTQSQQRQTVQNVLINNSSQISSTAAAHMPPSCTQATANTANIFTASMNQNERQKVVAPNIQQPAQAINPPPVQSSIGDGQSRVCERSVLQQRKEDLMKLLLFYRNVRQKYELLNRENNILRQRLQASTSQENAGPPPLLSSLPTAKPQANCAVVGQQNVTQTVPVQNSVQISYLGSFHSQNVQDNVVNAANQAGIPPNLSLQENAAPLNQMLKVDNENILGHNNYSVFDGGQGNVANGSTSALQSHGLETNKACQQVTLREFSGQTNSDQFGSSPNPTNGNKLKNGHGLHSLDEPAFVTQSLNPACPEKNSSGRLSSYTTGLTGNGQVTSLSQEAIEASLPLWKAVPQSTNRCSETQPNPCPVDSSLAAFRLLDEISGPINEVSSTTPVQKQDSTVPNQANPQIAIVSPLVQSKESLEEYQLSKVRIQGPAIENTTINGLNVHESECFSKILQALESLGANTMSNIESSRSKEHSVACQSNPDSSLPSDAEVSSQIKIKTSNDVEIVDDSLQISGICTLVEGNTFYNSSIAMMFNETSDNTPLPCNDLTEDHSKAEDAFCISKEPCSTSPKAVPIKIKSEPVDDDVAVGQIIKDDLHCNQIPCIDQRADQHMESAQQDSCCDLESSTIADQLTELLTEFPYGIKNYMSENNKLESTNRSSAKVKDKPVLKASAAPEEFEYVQGKEIDTQPERVPSPLVNLQDVVAKVSKPLLDLEPPADELPSEVQKPITKDIHEDSIAAMDTCLDDGFEIISNSPASDIHITLLDQDEISKIFPNEYVKSEKCNETKFEGFLECIKTEVPEPESNSPNKDLIDPTENGTDKNLFCCLFSWLNLTNKNAPKCKCKQLESSTIKPTKLSNDSLIISNIKTEPSLQSPKPTLPDMPKPSIAGFKILQPNDRPPKLDLVDSDHEEIQQPMDKPPKLELMVSEVEGVQNSNSKSPILIPQDISLKRLSSIENFQSIKDGLKNNPVNHERSLTPCLENGESTLKNCKIQSLNKCKSQSSRKSKKLFVKTDFLKTKHPDKEKRQDQDKTVTNVASSKSGSQSGFSKKSPVEHGKRPQRERVELNMSTRQSDQSTDPQAVSSYNGKKSSPGADVSSKTRGVRKRKEKESHFEKTRNVPSVQEYLERKRELYKKRTETRIESRESLLDEKQFAVERPSEMSGNPQLDLKRPLSPAKTNVTSKEKNRCSGTSKVYNQKDSLQSGGPYEAGHRKRKDLHKGQRKKPEKTQNRSSNKTQNCSTSKDKIYLSPCVSSRRASYDGINLAKLQIRHSPDKPKYIERRRSLESSCQTKPSNSAVKNMDSPKMLEFKLCPEFAQGSPTTQNQAREAMDPKPKSVVEGIKSSKEAWCNSIPFKKRKVDNIEGQGSTKLATSGESAPIYKPLEKNTSRPPQDSRATFNVFKQMYQEQRSKSLDLSQGNS